MALQQALDDLKVEVAATANADSLSYIFWECAKIKESQRKYLS